MGSGPESPRYRLGYRPFDVEWSSDRVVVIRRGPTNKLGFHFKTFSDSNEVGTVTAVLKINQDQCIITEGSLLERQRIVAIQDRSIILWNEAQVKTALRQATGDIRLRVCSPLIHRDGQVKRFLSVNSGSPSVTSLEGPVKRLAKSNSQETADSAETNSSSSFSLSSCPNLSEELHSFKSAVGFPELDGSVGRTASTGISNGDNSVSCSDNNRSSTNTTTTTNHTSCSNNNCTIHCHNNAVPPPISSNFNNNHINISSSDNRASSSSDNTNCSSSDNRISSSSNNTGISSSSDNRISSSSNNTGISSSSDNRTSSSSSNTGINSNNNNHTNNDHTNNSNSDHHCNSSNNCASHSSNSNHHSSSNTGINSNCSHNQTTTTTTTKCRSLPARMEDHDIILSDDDIVLQCAETDGPYYSLPPVLTPLPNTPTPSPSQAGDKPHPPAFFSMPVSTGIGGGAYAVGDKFGRSLGVEVCRAPGCSVQKTCLWHRFLIKYPQYVVWDPNPKKVELEKRKDTADFGFKFKVKIFDGPQEEVFALVTEVTGEGVAWNHLLPGDWIRSINGTAVITPKEAMNNFSNLQSLKLMIQRPASLSQKDPKGVMRLKQLAQSLNIRLAIPPPPPSPDPSLSGQQQSPATEAPNLKRGFAVSPSEVAWQGPNEGPLSRYDHDRNYVIRTRTDSGDSNPSPLSDPLRHQCPSWNGAGGSPFRSGCPTVVHRDLAQLGCPNSAEQTPVAAWSNNGAASTAHASHAASTASAATCPDKFLLPRARVVVCGAHGSAADFVKAWLVDIGSEINPDPDECVEVFHFSVTHHLETHRTGRESAQKCAITVNSAPELLSSLVSKQRMCNGAHCQSENGEEAVGASSLGHTRQCYGAGPNCGCVGSRQMNIVKNSSTNHAPTHCLHTANYCTCDQSLKHSLGSGDSSRCLKQCWCMDIVNVELYVINDEEFFHHCASWLLPTTSLVILTFHDHKILMQAEAETRRLSSLVHTVRASTNRHSPQANGTAATNSNGTARQSHPEVLLYGVPPSGSQQEHSVDEIQAIFYVTSCGCLLLNHHGLALPEIVRPQSVESCGHKVWQVCREALLDTSVHRMAVKVADALSRMNVVSMTASELHVLVSQVRGEGEGELATSSLKEIEDDLLRVGSLVVGGSSTTTTTMPCDRLLCPTNPQSETVYLLPHNVLRQLASLVICPHLDNHTPEIRQRWFRVMTTGRATGSDLADLFTSGDLSVDMLERLGVVFRFQSVSHSSSSLRSSGFSEGSGTEFLFPYFLAGLPGEEGGEVASDSTPPSQQFVLNFNGYVSWAEFYGMLGRLSTERATEVTMRGQCDCVIKHEGLVLTAHWKMNSDCDSIVVSASRANGDNKEPVTAQDIERLFSCVAPLSLPFTLRRADDSSLSSDLPAVQSGARRSPSQPDSQETSLKNRVASVPDSPENRPQVVRSLSQMRLSRLSWSTISEVARFLTIPMPTGHDWRSVAERAGKRMVDIVSYEQILSHEVPAMNFFREWMTSGVSVQTFIDILKDLDRPDVVDIILNHLRKKQCLPSDSD